MGLSLGTGAIGDLRLGSVAITRAYLGGTLVWEAAGGPVVLEAGPSPRARGDRHRTTR